jgi:hypothetical protein
MFDFTLEAPTLVQNALWWSAIDRPYYGDEVAMGAGSERT